MIKKPIFLPYTLDGAGWIRFSIGATLAVWCSFLGAGQAAEDAESRWCHILQQNAVPAAAAFDASSSASTHPLLPLSLLEQAHAMQRIQASRSESYFQTLLGLAWFYQEQRHGLAADFFAEEALALLTELPILPANAAEPFSILGSSAMQAGRLNQAEAYLKAAHQMATDQGQSVAAAQCATDLGILALNQARFSRAREILTAALAKLPANPTRRRSRGRALTGLGHAAFGLGDLITATEQFHRAKTYFEQHELTDERFYLGLLNNIGIVARNSGEWDEAEDYFNRVLKGAAKRYGPESRLVVLSLLNLSMVAKERGTLAQAAAYLKQALSLEEHTNHPRVMTILDSLARLSMDQGRLEQAAAYLERAQKLEQAATGPLNRVMVANSRARLAVMRGNPQKAKRLLETSLGLVETHFPEGKWAEETRVFLAQVCLKLGQTQEATHYLEEAASHLEAEIHRLSRLPQTRGQFMIKMQHTHRTLIAVAFELGQPEKAFNLLARFRTVGMRRHLEDRAAEDGPTGFRTDPVVSQLNRQYEATQRLARTHPEYSKQTHQKRVRLLTAKKERRLALDREQDAPMAASGPTLAEVQAHLAAGSLLLSYCVLDDATLLFLVSRNQFDVVRLPLDHDRLQQSMQTLQNLLDAADPNQIETKEQSALRRVSRRLFQDLIAPARTQIQAADRLIFLPDSPFNGLTWGLLIGPQADPSEEAYLIEWKPYTTASSAAVYGLLKRRPKWEDGPAAAFGDPLYHPSAPAAAGAWTAWQRTPQGNSLALQRLPHSADEVNAVHRRFGKRTHLFLRERATEGACKAISGDWQVIHLACHGVLDARFPMDSALIFSTGGETAGQEPENGVLKAWEVMEQMRFRADLAVLSACRSGLGGDGAGEGLQGLTGAFHVAGARTVLAAHWRISDASTNLLMQRFYHHLGRVEGTAEALRQAQLDLLHGRSQGWKSWFGLSEDTAHPYHWAGFQLAGPWD